MRDLFPLTGGGLFVIAGALLATFYYGRARLDHILLAVGVIGLALVAVSTVFVLLAALISWRSARKAATGGVGALPALPVGRGSAPVGSTEPLMVECGTATATGFKIRSLWWMPFVDLSWTWVEPKAAVTTRRERGYIHEDVCPTERDHFTSIVRRIEIRDVFGIARFAFRQRQARAGRFAPSVGGLEQMHVAHGLSGGDQISHQDGTASGDFYDMRSYGAGDPIRFILWKVFARTRELLVRTPELAIAPDRRTIAYLVAGEGDEPAAGAARVAVDSGALGAKWLLGADGCNEAVSSRDEAIDVLARSARASSEDSGALAEFLGRVNKGPTTRAVVFVPARPGPWIQRVTAAAASKPGEYPRVEFVVCTDGIGERAKRSAWARAVFSAPRADTHVALHEDLIAVVDALTRTGANVMVVDRPGGRLVHGRSLRGVAA